MQGRDVCPAIKRLVSGFLLLEPRAWRSKSFLLPFQVYSRINLQHWSRGKERQGADPVPGSHLVPLEIWVVAEERGLSARDTAERPATHRTAPYDKEGSGRNVTVRAWETLL